MIIKKRYLLNLILIIIPLFLTSFGQNESNKLYLIAQPFLKYYSPKEYKSNPANWSIVQDNRGVMYFGNNEGVLEFDGASWRNIKTPRSQIVRAIVKDNNGKIYLTAGTDIGFLEPDSIGKMKFKSLLKSFGNQYQQNDEIWDVAVNSEGVFFKTKNKIYRWDNNKITSWDSVYAFRLYNIDDKIYSRNQDVGLMKIEGDSLRLISNGDYFSSIGVFDMLLFTDENSNQSNKILITTNFNGIFIYDGKTVSNFKTSVDEYLINNQIYNACILKNGAIAFATQRGGVVVVSNKGELIKIINQNSELPTNVVFDVYSDFDDGLWIAADNGIALCEINAPFYFISPKYFFNTSINSVVNFKDRIYASNSMGIMYFNNKNAAFELVNGSNKPGNSFYIDNGNLLASTNMGLAIVDKEKFSKMLTENDSYKLVQSKYFPNRIYICHRTGISILQKNSNGKYKILLTPIVDEEIYSLVEDNKNSLWLRSVHGKIIHITGDFENLATDSDVKLIYKYFDDKTGFQVDSWEIYDINNKMILTTNRGTFTYSEITKKFIPDTTLGRTLSNSTTTIQYIKNGLENNLWVVAEINGELEMGKAIPDKINKYVWKPEPELKGIDLNSIIEIYSDYDSTSNKEILWISNDEGLIIYDPSLHRNINYKFKTLIRKVQINNDSLIYNGTHSKLHENNILPFSKNNVTFEVSALSFEKSEFNEYQYFLEGNDENWSNWTNETKKVYTNLSNGNYNFHVRSKNIYGKIGQEDLFAFKILAPWYLTWWAFLIYTFIIALGIFIVDRIQRKRLINIERNKAKLREADLIKKQAEELETVDKLVRVINIAEDLETLFNSLLEQTVRFIPQAEKAAVFLLDHKDNQFHVAFTTGYQVNDLEKITFFPEDLKKRYSDNSEEIEKGIYIISNTDNLFGDERLSAFSKAKSMLAMAVEWDNSLEAYVVFDSFADKNAFNPSTARILNKFREHAVSAISKAQLIKTLQEKNEEIIKTQEQLVTQQKLASLGALTAGIAHEIKNPLNFVNNFSEISQELLEEMKLELENDNKGEALSIADVLMQNLDKINQHGKRADSIVKGMLMHSRGSSGEKTLTDINDLLDQYVNLAYHGMRAQNKEFNITIEKNYDEKLEKINVIPQDISRVFLNIINNACYAAYDKKKKNKEDFSPMLKVITKNLKDKVEIRIGDNGNGIPADILDKIFQPFFTTKPTGEGTGLGLSLSYDIVKKVHDGELGVKTKQGEGTEFKIHLPLE
ncbi:MAG: hypothetical protein IPM32_03945 [Ignavibacteriae bacterium]|nr:hypothetical protein [Ignavibacteriota bacterium]